MRDLAVAVAGTLLGVLVLLGAILVPILGSLLPLAILLAAAVAGLTALEYALKALKPR
jgi:hypothetical protein